MGNCQATDHPIGGGVAERETMEHHKVTVYREAIRELWSLQAVMPAECNPGYAKWSARWNAQQVATEATRDEIIAEGIMDARAMLRFILAEHKAWQAAQEPKAEG